jgi:cell division GTPase FtsZ
MKKLETKAYSQTPLWAKHKGGESMTSMFTFVENENSAKIKVIGVGGAGGQRDQQHD